MVLVYSNSLCKFTLDSFHPRINRSKMNQMPAVKKDLWDLIGNTPLVRLNSLSDATGCDILGKAEWMNPGGSIKDRAGRGIIDEAIKQGRLKEGKLSNYLSASRLLTYSRWNSHRSNCWKYRYFPGLTS